MDFSHVSVLLHETVDSLGVRPDGIYVDGTAGGGGHSFELASRLDPEKGRLIAFDRDPEAVAAATERLKGLPATVVHSEFSGMADKLHELGIDRVDGVMLDLGVSSHQLDAAERGFSFHKDAPLDMRMSGEGLSARDVVNEWSYEQLRTILFDYGEEKFAPSIAKAIVAARETKPIETTLQLAEIVKSAVPQKVRREKNPCRKTFQAVRIAVNDELGELDRTLDTAFSLLNVGGRLAVITFHSLEDRMVKKRFAGLCTGCTCPPDFPQCVCGKKPLGQLVFRKPVTASEGELEVNSRSRSAKLRTIERVRMTQYDE
ncbi:16S rRNA (cytosine1402-N4)-methyltransferase [Ruminococcus sp. YE71]|uniref:16S rRNA (cytosine(1402)-N(4))-methyltransferase RsmH n=1 Tax=unclassified Ruminococcus TaxID=2608920 RepID=UPI000884E7CF|nr:MULTISPECIES: 16S rRNA (cytosine(1402)-N(4))-methyltransferase RsmH [unclassified Ruminococcus]SDA11885.1 16S rRNA (cytosine1402-N4)-methyltransferase [Ruminococcus sp. YE78]SFW15907.1 16S rRNA (cytosine1402-N4)-methyltransferase [Ruminococcus sp. YE71]